MKPIVHYQPNKYNSIVVGLSASVIPCDHPDFYRVDNGLPVRTSTVISHDPATGCFETRNSIYTPAVSA